MRPDIAVRDGGVASSPQKVRRHGSRRNRLVVFALLAESIGTGVHIGHSFANLAPNKESHLIHPTQETPDRFSTHIQ